ncbi:c-type cytochrome [Jannaschia ovalis]|uniref:Cytochrome c n=1 Tax=Jannaschia ovalis TaxID=3038773 RepID=A0ABY8LD64_9RHOB|nr:cytochrome c [Jannaschia sp. GRR-S6-38]WGH78542.1 cytochrome c [Jannaschia sp. GRR-S6-38]
MKRLTLIAATAAASAIAASGLAESHEKMPAEIAARHGQMQLMSLHLGVVGNMARGNIDYDAAQAQMAADNLVAVSQISQDLLWPEGTANSDSQFSRALPAIWESRADFDAKWDAFGTATLELQAVAGDGLDPMKGGLGAVGRTCGGCHDDYRVADD